ncbi:MAG: glycerol-3-phosphate 1-O-acyltransferase PlsY [Nitrospirota bacterium]
MIWAFCALAYILGSIPFGLIIAKVYGADLRSKGSGNIGATNALRVLGKKAGALTLLGDMLKGTAAVLIALNFAGYGAGVLAAGAAVIGHDFPIFAKFKGGKGVATSFGAILALEPYIGLACLAVWIAAFLVFRISSVGALVAFAAFPVLVLILKSSNYPLIMLSFFLAFMIFIKHHENIKRLVRGEESRVSGK